MQPEDQTDVPNNNNYKTTVGNDFVDRQPNSAVEFHMGSDNIMNSPISTTEVTTETTTETPAAPKKKSKIKLIVTLCVATIILLGGAIAAFFFLNWRNSPEIAVLEAATQAIQAKHVKLSGDINFILTDPSESGIKNIHINLASQSSLLPSAIQSSLTIEFEDDASVEIDIEGAFMKDGAVYLKFSGLQNLLDQSDLPEDSRAIVDLFAGLIEDIDGEWYRLTADDLYNNDADEVEKFNCLSISLSAIADSDTVRGEIASAYKKYPLFDAKTADVSSKYDTGDLAAYAIKSNVENLTRLEADLKANDTLQPLATCLGQFEDQDADDVEIGNDEIDIDIDALDADLYETYADNIEGEFILLVNKGWGKHELKGILVDAGNDGIKIKADLRFEYPETLDIQGPTDVKPFSYIIESIEDIVTKSTAAYRCSGVPESDRDLYNCSEDIQLEELED